MISLSYDLHLHSCLSPCGDGEMTPGNIAGMAMVNGLDVAALTDHNTARNCPAFLKWAERYGLVGIPGMELCTAEEVHVVCLFARLEDALSFDKYVYARLLPVENRPEIFGEQVLMDQEDRPAGTEPRLLISATSIPFDQVYGLMEEYRGLMIPAHLDKNTTSLLSNLGFVPPGSTFSCAEFHDFKNLHRVRREHPYFENCNVICCSDAHYLQDIQEPEYQLYAKSREIPDILEALTKRLSVHNDL